jgi:hypothetical protein
VSSVTVFLALKDIEALLVPVERERGSVGSDQSPR